MAGFGFLVNQRIAVIDHHILFRLIGVLIPAGRIIRPTRSDLGREPGVEFVSFCPILYLLPVRAVAGLSGALVLPFVGDRFPVTLRHLNAASSRQ